MQSARLWSQGRIEVPGYTHAVIYAYCVVIYEVVSMLLVMKTQRMICMDNLVCCIGGCNGGDFIIDVFPNEVYCVL